MSSTRRVPLELVYYRRDFEYLGVPMSGCDLVGVALSAPTELLQIP